MSNPWMKFYTADWRSDPRLKMCSAGARGVWVELICLMHEAVPYGHLLVHGQAPNEAQLASLTGIPLAELSQYLAELEQMGVYSRTKEGVIYSRKLVRMEAKSAKARKNGKKGGNPTLGKQRGKSGSLNPPDNGRVKPQKPEARSQIDDDDDAGAREPPSVDNFSSDRGQENPTLRERILAACGVDPVSGLIGPNGGAIGTQADMFEVGRWQADLGLDDPTILAVVTDTMARKRDGPPRRLSYFTRPMQEEAARRAAPPLQPIQQEFENHARGSQEIYAPGERIPGDRRYGSGRDYRGGSAAHRALYEGFARFAAQVEAGGDGD